MKSNITPIDRAVELSEDEFIVSKTDTKGRITYANRVFMQVAGYSESKLLGIQHNLVRHPDMPRGVFKFLWQELKAGHEFFGYVKNLCSDGSYYWILANITCDYDENGVLKGYYSVRRKPTEKAIAAIEPLYKKMIEIERSSDAASAADKSLTFLHQSLEQQHLEYDQFVLSLDE